MDNSKQLIGEDRIDHTPMDEIITLTAGKAFDVVGERVKTSQKVLGKRSRKETWRIKVRNHKRGKVLIHIVERLNPAVGGTEWEIVRESRHHSRKTANAIEYLAKVPPRKNIPSYLYGHVSQVGSDDGPPPSGYSRE